MFPVLWVSGCATGGGAPADLEPTKLSIRITAEPEVNPDDKGQAAPILVRVYELKNESAFEAADFFGLSTADKTLLSGDLLWKTEYLLRPGETRHLRRKSHPEAVAIGILAAYRDLPASTWRAVHRLPDAPAASWWRFAIPAHAAKLAVRLQASGIHLSEEK